MPDACAAAGSLPESGGYDPGYYEALRAAEDEHFWFSGRARAIEAVVAPLVAAWPAPYRVLEVGCGTGHVLAMLERVCVDGHVIGMDLFRDGLLFARRRTSCPLVQASCAHPPFSTRFDLVGLFDVLEHLHDDLSFLESAKGLLTARGALVLTVPARRSLWSAFDERSHHCRRYEEQGLAELLTAAGYRIDYLTPLLASIFPLVWASRRLSRWRRSDDPVLADLRIRPLLNPLLRSLLDHEARSIVRRRWRLPVGTSLLALARPA